MFHTISETAEEIGETAVTIRYWSNQFSKYIKPKRNAKGNRLYRDSDLNVLRQIRYLTRECGYSLDVVEQKLQSTESEGDSKQKAIAALLEIKHELELFKESL